MMNQAQITTQYANEVVPAGNMILMGLSMVIIIGVLIAGIVLLRNHIPEWVHSLLVGFVAFLAIGYLLWTLAIQGLLAIPAVSDYSKAHEFRFNIIVQLIGFIMEAGGIFGGLFYLLRSKKKRQEYPYIGDALSFAFAGFLSAILIQPVLLNAFTYLSQALQINRDSFDASVNALILNGETQENAIEYLLMVVRYDATPDLLEAIRIVLKTGTLLAVSAITYGILTERIEKKYSVLAVVLLFLSYVPYLLALVFHGTPENPSAYNRTLQIVCQAAVTVISLFALWLIATRKMEGDMRMLRSYSRKEEKRKEEAMQHKMPKITMPKD